MTDLAIWIDDERILRLSCAGCGPSAGAGAASRKGADLALAHQPLSASGRRLMAPWGHRMIRYADDFVSWPPAQGGAGARSRRPTAAARPAASRSTATDRIVPPGEELRFLGCSICATRMPRATLRGSAPSLTVTPRARA